MKQQGVRQAVIPLGDTDGHRQMLQGFEIITAMDYQTGGCEQRCERQSVSNLVTLNNL
jgi:hypothetical protein